MPASLQPDSTSMDHSPASSEDAQFSAASPDSWRTSPLPDSTTRDPDCSFPTYDYSVSPDRISFSSPLGSPVSLDIEPPASPPRFSPHSPLYVPNSPSYLPAPSNRSPLPDSPASPDPDLSMSQCYYSPYYCTSSSVPKSPHYTQPSLNPALLDSPVSPDPEPPKSPIPDSPASPDLKPPILSISKRKNRSGKGARQRSRQKYQEKRKLRALLAFKQPVQPSWKPPNVPQHGRGSSSFTEPPKSPIPDSPASPDSKPLFYRYQ